MDFPYSLYDAPVSIDAPMDKARAVVDAMERDMARGFAEQQFTLALRMGSMLAASALACCVLSASAAAPVASVPQVDLGRYVGTWHEIASFPMFFQRHCLGDTTAQYGRLRDGSVSVINRCRTADGFDEVRGKATVVPGSGNARLKVTFFWPFRGDYWVIGLDEDYRWAVVGNPNRKYLWVLSRTPQLPPALLEAALRSAATQGFDLAKLRYTPQGGAARPQ